jgi:hypothetical protein
MSPNENPKESLLAGVEILAPVLRPHGFVFKLEAHDKGSGGHFASGAYCKDTRRLELHFRYSLGMVSYHIGDDSLDHETYMRLLGVYGRNQYPDFPQEPMESFHHLAADIQEYCENFTSGDGKQFHSLAKAFRTNPAMFKGTP